MNKIVLFLGGVLTLLPAMFKIARPNLLHWKDVMGSAETFIWSILYVNNVNWLGK